MKNRYDYYPSTKNAELKVSDRIIVTKYDYNPKKTVRLINENPLNYEGALFGFKVKKLRK